MNKYTATLAKGDEKKHSVRYEGAKGSSDIGTIYIPKTLLGNKPWPDFITIILEVVQK